MKQRIFSGVQPSGNLHIGNYLGAIKNWVSLQNDYEAIFCIVDLHAITVPQDPKVLREKIIEIAKIYVACGIDLKKSTIFVQSQVKEHAELGWILNTITKNGELAKMTQFKDKSGFDFDEFENKLNFASDKNFKKIENDSEIKDQIFDLSIRQIVELFLGIGYKSSRNFFQEFKEKFNSVGVGLYDYPVLMAADILLYDTAVVPVGEDQVQHIELARTLARRFNTRFGETFIVPEAKINQEGKRIMGLDNPAKKMSKSAESSYNYIALNDDAETVRRKIKKAVTDSGSEIVYSDEKPALKNLINIYSLFSGKTTSEIEKMYSGKGYGDFKNDLAEVINNFLVPFQERFNAISDEEILAVLKDGAEKVRKIAEKKMREVKEKIGFLV